MADEFFSFGDIPDVDGWQQHRLPEHPPVRSATGELEQAVVELRTSPDRFVRMDLVLGAFELAGRLAQEWWRELVETQLTELRHGLLAAECRLTLEWAERWDPPNRSGDPEYEFVPAVLPPRPPPARCTMLLEMTIARRRACGDARVRVDLVLALFELGQRLAIEWADELDAHLLGTLWERLQETQLRLMREWDDPAQRRSG